MVGRTISHYEILDELGEGGMGVVYCARDVRLDRLVALKILPAEHMSNLERRSRFVREARTASALNHPNIITIYEIETVDDVDYIAMEFVRGSTLRELIPPAGLPVHDALGYASQVAAGLGAGPAARVLARGDQPAHKTRRQNGGLEPAACWHAPREPCPRYPPTPTPHPHPHVPNPP